MKDAAAKLDHLVWRLEHNQTAKALCKEAADAIKALRAAIALPALTLSDPSRGGE